MTEDIEEQDIEVTQVILSFQRDERVSPLPRTLKYIYKKEIENAVEAKFELNFKGCHSQVTLCSRDCFQPSEVT